MNLDSPSDWSTADRQRRHDEREAREELGRRRMAAMSPYHRQALADVAEKIQEVNDCATPIRLLTVPAQEHLEALSELRGWLLATADACFERDEAREQRDHWRKQSSTYQGQLASLERDVAEEEAARLRARAAEEDSP